MLKMVRNVDKKSRAQRHLEAVTLSSRWRMARSRNENHLGTDLTVMFGITTIKLSYHSCGDFDPV